MKIEEIARICHEANRAKQLEEPAEKAGGEE